jgi:hypothetical protein
MGRNPLWKDMRWENKEQTCSFAIRIPKELNNKLKEIAKIEETTISFLLRRQLITLVRKKCREYHIENLKLPEFAYPGPRYQRPKRKKLKSESGTVELPQINNKDTDSLDVAREETSPDVGSTS